MCPGLPVDAKLHPATIPTAWLCNRRVQMLNWPPVQTFDQLEPLEHHETKDPGLLSSWNPPVRGGQAAECCPVLTLLYRPVCAVQLEGRRPNLQHPEAKLKLLLYLLAAFNRSR